MDVAKTVEANLAAGLTGKEAAERFARFGPNTVKEETNHPVLVLLSKFWAPVPWMLEVTLALEFALGKYPEAAIIGALLLFNAALSFVQENRTQHALNLLRQRLSVQARVLRDGCWQVVSAQDLVPGDVIHLRMGDLVPADVRLSEGEVLMDQSSPVRRASVKLEQEDPANRNRSRQARVLNDGESPHCSFGSHG